MVERVCKKCLLPKPAPDFRLRTDRGGRRYVCLACEKIAKEANYQANRQERIQQACENQRANHTDFLAYQAQYRADHKDELTAFDKERYKTPERYAQIIEAVKRRRARKQAAEGSHTECQWSQLKRFYDYRCLCCGRSEPDISLTEDHVVPLSKGGSDYIDNIQPLCVGCNAKKHTKILDFRTLSARTQTFYPSASDEAIENTSRHAYQESCELGASTSTPCAA